MAHGPSLVSPLPPTPIDRLISPFRSFISTESSGGIVLLVFTVFALAWANSPWWESYHHLWETKLTIGTADFALSKSLHHWINDGLMVIFFFLVGLEIKRELLVGELASVRQATLPVAAAVGGMVIPALVYFLINPSGPGARGWGIPMATDIAFALGVLALLGKRVPFALKVFLAALAIADDLGAVLVIALFYTDVIVWNAVAGAGFMLAMAIMANRMGVRRPAVYGLLGLGLWLAVFASGVHATVAGVLLAMAIPVRTRIDTGQFMQRSRLLLQRFDEAGIEARNVVTNPRQQAAIAALEKTCEEAQAPLQKIEHALQPYVAFGIIPLFALANAGVHLTGDISEAFAQPITLGVVFGLALGKPLGITLLTWMTVRAGLADLPRGITWRHIHGVSWLAGIGFTMSLFVGNLAFGEGAMLDSAKIGILAASAAAGIVGWLILSRLGPTQAET
jgi:NhaA family Na+:H+ antiporter